MPERPALLRGNERAGRNLRIRLERHNIEIGPDAALLGQQTIAKQAGEIGHIGGVTIWHGKKLGRILHIPCLGTEAIRIIAPQRHAIALAHEAREAQAGEARKFAGNPEHVDRKLLQHR